MDESFLTESRFRILADLTKEKKSATELAKSLNYSLPYILSQLALLEAKNVIYSETPKTEKNPGKPKKYYYLSKSVVNIAMLVPGFGAKFSLAGDKRIEQYLQILANIESEYQCAISQYYWQFIQSFKQVHALAKLSIEKERIELVAITSQKHLESLRKEISSYNVQCNETNTNMHIACWVHSLEEFSEAHQKQDKYYHNIKKRIKTLFDKNGSIHKIQELL